MEAGEFYIALVFGAIVVAVTVFNVRRAPPPTGRRNLLLIAVLLFVTGTLIEGAGETGLLTDTVALVGDLMRLIGVDVLVYVFLKVKIALEAT